MITRKIATWIYFFSFLLQTLWSITAFSQDKVVFDNNPYLVIDGGAYLVVDNPASDAIITLGTGGNIISEGEFNRVKWNIGTNIGTYTVPFTQSPGNKIPLALNITTAGTGAGSILFSTHGGTDWNNSTYKPSDVTNMASSCKTDNSAAMVDRFWNIDAEGYSTKPSPDITFTYTDAEWNATGNTITESALFAQRFNPVTDNWGDWLGAPATANILANTISTGAIEPGNFFRSWSLTDQTSFTTADAGTDAGILYSSSITLGANPAVSSGIAPYTFQWAPATALDDATIANPVATPTITTTYTLTVTDANGCVSSANTTITVTPSLVINTVELGNYFYPDALQYTISGAGLSGTYNSGSIQNFNALLPAPGNWNTISMDFRLDPLDGPLSVSYDVDHTASISNVNYMKFDPSTNSYASIAVPSSSYSGTDAAEGFSFTTDFIVFEINHAGYPAYDPNWVQNVHPFCSVQNSKNWTSSKAFDENGNAISESKVYYDYLGREIQTQARSFSDNDVLETQTIYDAYGRVVLQTLPAPMGQQEICFKDNFVTNPAGGNYSYTDFDIPNYTTSATILTDGEVDKPKSLGNVTEGTLGWYYSNNNTAEPYVPASGFPYSRVEFDDNNGGRVRRTSMAGEQLRMGRYNSSQYLMPAADELRYLYGAPLPADFQALKSIAVDENGKEVITFSDIEGKTLATCMSGQENGANVRTMNVSSVIKKTIGDAGFTDIHLPEGCTNITLTNSVFYPRIFPFADITYTITYNILDLKTGKYVEVNGSSDITSSSVTLSPGYYRIIHKSGAIQKPYLVNEVLVATLEATYTLNYYNFSLYNYDKANRLKSIVPPAGIDNTYDPSGTGTPNHTMLTTYDYNSLGWLLSETTPDAGKTEYVYRKDGKIRFSQNALQRASNTDKFLRKFSYTNYDNAGRAIETGEYDPSLPGTPIPGSSATLSNTYFENYYDYDPTAVLGDPFSVHYIAKVDATIDPARCTQQSYVAYDTPDPNFYTLTNLSATDYKQEFLLGQTSKTWNAANTTWYSYDEQGRTKWTVQRIENMPLQGTATVKTINYTYDFNGNVTQVDYQKEIPAESFYHYYTYDNDKRLKKVLTSLIPALSEGEGDLQAQYFYYKHGPLKRMELGNLSPIGGAGGGCFQGIDYVYTINGWLKSINTPDLNERDPGKDGVVSSNNHVAKDLFGMTLDYFPGDYTREGSFIQYYLSGYAMDIGSAPSPYREILTDFQPNGLIKAQRWQTQIPSSASVSHSDEILMNAFLYDKKKQLTSSFFGTATSYSDTYTNFTALDDYKVSGITYDNNGNILSLDRKDATGVSMDNLTYNYTALTNKLHKVSDAVTGNPYNALDVKAGQANDNYLYDEIGQLTADANAGAYYEYDVYGMLTAVFSDAAKTSPLVKYTYDEKGFRIRKTNYTSGAIAKETWYVRDASGNVLSIYEKDIANSGTIAQTELPIYGAGRIGIFSPSLGGGQGEAIYELTDHLGNVRATFAKQKTYSAFTDFNSSNNDNHLFTFNANLSTAENYPSLPGTSVITQSTSKQNGTSIALPYFATQTINAEVYYKASTTTSAGLVFELKKDADGSVLETYTVPITDYSNTWQQLTYAYTASSTSTDAMTLYIYPSSTGTDNNPTYWDDFKVSYSTASQALGGGFEKVDQLSLADYYPHGSLMPGRNYVGSNKYRHGYQGQYAEKDEETGFNSFELRNYAALLGRWNTTDPFRQYHSPYVGMGNNPVNGVDPTGGVSPDWYQNEDKTALTWNPSHESSINLYGETYNNVGSTYAWSMEMPGGEYGYFFGNTDGSYRMYEPLFSNLDNNGISNYLSCHGGNSISIIQNNATRDAEAYMWANIQASWGSTSEIINGMPMVKGLESVNWELFLVSPKLTEIFLGGAAKGVGNLAMRSDIVIKGGRSGQLLKNATGPANSVVKGGAEGRVLVTNQKGQVIWDITKERAKSVTPGQGFGPKVAPTQEQLNLIKQIWGN